MIAKMMLAATCAIAAMASTEAAAQTYTYNYLGTQNTAGSFTFNQSGTTFNLTAFSGTVVGTSYTLSEVGLGTVAGRPYLGGLLNGVGSVAAGTKDFFQTGEFTPGTATFTDTFRYGTPGATSNATSAPVLFSLVPATVQSAVPEPAAWAMMIGGFGVVGGAMRRKRKVNTTVSFA